MPDPTSADHRGFANSRLTEAQDKFLNAVSVGYDDDIAEAAKIASLVWDAAIDILSALALLDGEVVTGVSSDMRRYARYRLPENVYRNWKSLARLHNFQHRPNLPESEFLVELYYTGIMLELFNRRLPQQLRLPGSSFDWLSTNVPQHDSYGETHP